MTYLLVFNGTYAEAQREINKRESEGHTLVSIARIGPHAAHGGDFLIALRHNV